MGVNRDRIPGGQTASHGALNTATGSQSDVDGQPRPPMQYRKAFEAEGLYPGDASVWRVKSEGSGRRLESEWDVKASGFRVRPLSAIYGK